MTGDRGGHEGGGEDGGRQSRQLAEGQRGPGDDVGGGIQLHEFLGVVGEWQRVGEPLGDGLDALGPGSRIAERVDAAGDEDAGQQGSSDAPREHLLCLPRRGCIPYTPILTRMSGFVWEAIAA